MMDDTILRRLHDELDWPTPEQLLSPDDEVASMLAASVRDKIERPLERWLGEDRVRTGIVAVASRDGETPQLQAIVCEFANHASPDVLTEAHRLAWNFCHAPVLVTIDPTQVRVWSCYERPEMFLGSVDSSAAELADVGVDLRDHRSLARRAGEILSLASLASGAIVRSNRGRFAPDKRADGSLLANLKSARRRLVDLGGLSVDLVHTLLARLMFVQFLFDRKDQTGRSALDREKLAELLDDGILSSTHEDLASILRDKTETYRLFRWLDERFNGDLFPGKSGIDDEDDAEWAAEIRAVRSEHLAVLANLVAGTVEIEKGQLNLWPMYSFETMPLEFVSCIYEEFVTPVAQEDAGRGGRTGTHYTPIYLVDFVLDGVLPWDGRDWNVRILDPACGSGVFLVRSFQRLIYRWKRAHPDETPHADVLAGILERSIFGIDRDPHAVRVASFSLYLAMCDEIDPREYWDSVKFPVLRGRRILRCDFFDAPARPVPPDGEEGYDVVVGNAPWGRGTLSAAAREWAGKRGWKVDNKDVGVLFVPRAAEMLREGGRLSLVQSAGSILLNASALDVRTRLFEDVAVEEIVNFTILRRRLFPNAESPACVVTAMAKGPTEAPVAYVCPRLSFSDEDYFRIRIEADDVTFVRSEEWNDPWIWTVLMFGGRRDLALLRRLRATGTTLAEVVAAGDVLSREGVIPEASGQEHRELAPMRFLARPDFPEGEGLSLASERLPPFGQTRVRRKTEPEAFRLPQMIVKQSWVQANGRFLARLSTEATVVTQSYLSLHALSEKGEDALTSACVVMNSRLATYFMALTNGRMSYRAELRAKDFLALPFVGVDEDPDRFAENGIIDAATERWFALQPHEVAHVDDAMTFLLPEILRDKDGESTRSTFRGARHRRTEDDLHDYCSSFLDVLDASTSETAPRYSASILVPEPADLASDRIAAIHLAGYGGPRIRWVKGDARLTEQLREWRAVRVRRSGIVESRRIVTAYANLSPEQGSPAVPSVILVRPNERRFWSRTRAMRDADETIQAGMKLVGAGGGPFADVGAGSLPFADVDATRASGTSDRKRPATRP